MILHTKTYEAPPIRRREILRYAGCAEADAATASLMEDCLTEAADALAYKVCYRELPVVLDGETCNFGAFSVSSGNLAGNLSGCGRVILLAATVGVGIDRLIQKYSRIAPSRALMLQAIGAERIEALCDTFCDTLKQTYTVRARFSPGYGDLPLTCQTELFALLNCSKHIGLTLNDSLLMSPTKSVTAFVGLGNK